MGILASRVFPMNPYVIFARRENGIFCAKERQHGTIILKTNEKSRSSQ